MKTRIISLAVAIQLLSMSLCFNVFAEDVYIKNFSKKNAYTQNQFSDVNSEWFASSVQQAYETGLMYGDSETTFNPNGNIDNAAVITIAARLHSIYNYGTENFNTNSSVWYEPYMEYAVSKGICDKGINPNAISTRSFFAGIMGNAIDSSIFTQKNVIADGVLTDVNGWYSNTVYTFYRAGVLSGNDKYGTFAPDTPITRAEVAAILSRIVKPSERVNVALENRPMGTYSIMEDNGSLDAYKQRAILANLKVLLNGEEKDSNWQTDVYKVTYPAEKGTPPETIIIPKKYLDTRFGSVDSIAFKKSHINPTLSGEEEIPIVYIKNGLSWPIGSKKYNLSVVNTGGKVDFSDGLFINGDLKLYYPGIADKAAWTDTLTYNRYTAETQNLINAVPFQNTPISQNLVKEYISKTYGENNIGRYDFTIDDLENAYNTSENDFYNIIANVNNQNVVYVGYLTDWDGQWYITMNKSNMYQPLPRENGNSNQTEYIFTPTDTKTKEWCKNNFGKYVIALVNPALETPLMLAEISGYAASKDNAKMKSWDYSNGTLKIEWKADISFNNPLIIIDNEGQKEMTNTDGLVPALPHPDRNRHPSSYSDLYCIDYEVRNVDYSGKYFTMLIDGDDITLENNGITVSLTLNSTKATVDDEIVSVTAPKKINGDIYLPARFVVDTLLNKSTLNTSTNKTEDEYEKIDEEYEQEVDNLLEDGYARICHTSGRVMANYSDGHYLEGYEDIKFQFARGVVIDGYNYAIGQSTVYDFGTDIGFNLNSKKACIRIWYSATEYGQKVINIPEPTEIDGEIYVPVDEILEALENDGYTSDGDRDPSFKIHKI